MSTPARDSAFQLMVGDDPPTFLIGERLRDGRIAVSSRVRESNGDWRVGELFLLDRASQLALSAWLTPAVEAGWIDTARNRLNDLLRPARELYGEDPGALSRLAFETLAEIPPVLLARAMILLANAVGPHAHERLVERLNETDDTSEELHLRRQLADENESFAYAVAAAGLFDAISRGVLPEDLEE